MKAAEEYIEAFALGQCITTDKMGVATMQVLLSNKEMGNECIRNISMSLVLMMTIL